MSYINTKGKYHVALNGVGLLLQGAPDRLGYHQGQAPVYGQRFASGDRDYNDLSQWWYFVQTDWSGGTKDSVSWANDAKYYYSTNIDAWSDAGSIKLTRKQLPVSGDHDFTDSISCGFEGEVNGVVYKFIGTEDSSDSRPHIYRAPSGESQTFVDISTTTFATTDNVIAQLSARLGILWSSIISTGVTWIVSTYTAATDTTVWTDQSAFIYNGGATISFQPQASRCHTEYAGVQYVFVEDPTTNKYALVKTSTANPTGAGDWSKIFEMTNTNGSPIACAPYNGNIYYLVDHISYAELWQYNVANATNILIQRFNNTTLKTWGIGNKNLVNFNGKLIITITNNEVWELDGDTLTRIYVKDELKRNSTNVAEIDVSLYSGCVVQDNKCWWGNLMYDGTNFYNTWKGDADNLTNQVIPLFADSNLRIWESYIGDTSVLWSVNLMGSSYKGSADKNFLVFSNFDNVAGVEKLAYSTILLFKPFLTGQKIVVEYLLGEFSDSATWTTLGTASAAIDGTTVRNKTFFFPTATIFNKVWFRVKLEGAGSDTPEMTDLVMEFLPMPTYKKLWTLNVNASDTIKRLDGRQVDTTGRELKSLLEQAWWTKSTLDFQDFDYCTTTISDNPLSAAGTTITVASTVDFPEQGRVRIEDEEVFYTGKTPTTFTGCTRGARGTRAVTHAQTTVLNNAYKVIITEYQTRVPIALQDKELEYTVGVTLREV